MIGRYKYYIHNSNIIGNAINVFWSKKRVYASIYNQSIGKRYVGHTEHIIFLYSLLVGYVIVIRRIIYIFVTSSALDQNNQIISFLSSVDVRKVQISQSSNIINKYYSLRAANLSSVWQMINYRLKK